MTSGTIFVDLVEYLVKSLVDQPEYVEVREFEDENVIIVEVTVADNDMGRVIGKGGSVVNSMRTLLQVVASKKGKRVSLEIL